MKAPFRLLLAAVASSGLLAAAPAQAQTFSNSSFDNWAVRNSVEAPVNWQTTDDFAFAALGLRIATNTVTKTATVHGGAFAAQLQTQNVTGLGEVPGLVTLGNSFSGGADLPGGLPFTARPRSLQLYYQLSGPRAVSDSASVLVELTRNVNGSAEPVASGQFVFTALAATYTLATVPLRYQSTLVPDSVSVFIISGNAQRITAGTTLLIDDLTFVGTAAATRDAALSAALSIAPNPSPDGRYVLSSTEADLLTAPLSVLDATGRVVLRQAAPGRAAAPTRPLDLSGLPVGFYTVQLASPRGLVTRKLVR